MKQCETCGAFNDDGAKFCTSCGSQISQAAASPQPEPAAESPVYPAYAAESPYAPYAPKVATKKEFVDLPENAPLKKQIRASGIICYVSAGITLLAAIISANNGGSMMSFVDVVILLVLGLLIHLKQSKVCAIILLVYSVINVVYGLIVYGRPLGIVIVIAGIYAVSSAFKLDKAWKEYKAK
ncbi:MAG: hypothetical protein IJH53_03095 [Oscillospiraceae bacterium]|nr:hypothetical protein [Oscillospiraceae bacterium]